MKVSFRVEGFEALQTALSELSLRVQKAALVEALMDAAEPMRADMALRAPRAPGQPNIADNILIAKARGAKIPTVEVGPRGPKKKAPFFYGHFQEYGTSQHGAQPFARPAFEATWQKSLDVLQAELWRILASKGIGQSVNAPSSVASLGRLL